VKSRLENDSRKRKHGLSSRGGSRARPGRSPCFSAETGPPSEFGSSKQRQRAGLVFEEGSIRAVKRRRRGPGSATIGAWLDRGVRARRAAAPTCEKGRASRPQSPSGRRRLAGAFLAELTARRRNVSKRVDGATPGYGRAELGTPQCWRGIPRRANCGFGRGGLHVFAT
jgi:hypothetical protein